jgi:hypothetical protein
MMTGTPRDPLQTEMGTEPAVPRKAPATVRGDGVLFPALVVGLGQQGLNVLRQLRCDLVEQFGSVEALPNLRMLYLDTDPEGMQAATTGRAAMALRSHEVQLARLHRPSHYLKPRDGRMPFESWLEPKMLYRMPRQLVPAGIRALGRLAFVDNCRAIFRRLEAELEVCTDADNLARAAETTGLGLRSNQPRVYVLTSLAGGTGGGMFIDLAYTLRHVLGQLGYRNPEVVGLFLVPTVSAPAAPEAPAAARGTTTWTPPNPAQLARTQALGNTYAALLELNHFSAPQTRFTARYDAGSPGAPCLVDVAQPPFDRCLLLPLPEGDTSVWRADGEAAEVVPPAALQRSLAQAARFLFCDLTTPLGRNTAELRNRNAARAQAGTSASARPPVTAPARFHTFGMHRILWPRRVLLQRAGRRLCRRLVQQWMTKDAQAVRDSVREWVQDQWQRQGLASEALIHELQEACTKALQEAPETTFSAVLDPLQSKLQEAQKARAEKRPATPGTDPLLPRFSEALDRLVLLVGPPDGEGGAAPPAPGEASVTSPLAEALRQAGEALAAQCEQKMDKLAVCLIEHPGFRLAGAEEAIRQLVAVVEQVLEHHEPLVKELHERAAAAYGRLHTLLETSGISAQPTSNWLTPFSRKPPAAASVPAAELVELLRSFVKCRYQGMVLRQVTALYVSLRGQLSDQIREVGYCRQRLVELLDLLEDEARTRGGTDKPPAAAAARPTAPETPPSGGRFLFPEGCLTVEEAIAKLEGEVRPEGLQEFDQRMQAVIRNQFRALVHVCMTSANVLREFVPVLQQEAETFLEARLGGADVVQMYIKMHEADQPGPERYDALHADLANAFAAAAPVLAAGSKGEELSILGAPDGPEESRFRHVARQALPVHHVIPTQCFDEVLIYRERALPDLTALPQFGAPAREAYRQMSAVEHFTPHCRSDIDTWVNG